MDVNRRQKINGYKYRNILWVSRTGHGHSLLVKYIGINIKNPIAIWKQRLLLSRNRRGLIESSRLKSIVEVSQSM